MKKFLSSRLPTGLRRIIKNKAKLMQAGGESGHSWLAKMSASPYWTRRRWIHLFGWPGAAGIGLLIACLAFYFAAIRPAQLRLDTARQSAIELQKHGRHNASANNQPPGAQLAEFYRTFPDEKNLLPWIEKIFTLAHDQGISLDQGEYKLSSDKVGKLMRFQMSLPIKGEYPQIRKYLDSLLAEIPVVSLEHLQLERQKVGDPALEAKIRLALYMEQKP
ncbi:MAG: GspMb/PilO family protein [Gallionella sp.]|jgi:hypothetical protein